MPDRTGVDWKYGEMFEGTPPEPIYAAVEVTPQSRALVALSEDRQWLVVLEDIGAWAVRVRDKDSYRLPYGVTDKCEWITDTGQSAEDVLREWLEGRDA